MPRPLLREFRVSLPAGSQTAIGEILFRRNSVAAPPSGAVCSDKQTLPDKALHTHSSPRCRQVNFPFVNNSRTCFDAT